MMRLRMNQRLAPVKESIMTDAMVLLFEKTKVVGDVQDDGYWEESFEMDHLVDRVKGMLHGDVFAEDPDDPSCDGMSQYSTLSSRFEDLEDCFKTCNEQTLKEDRKIEFLLTQDFVLEEQNSTRARQAAARHLEASEEKRLAADVAQLKGLRLKSMKSGLDEDLRWKISNAERSYTSRKMVFAKAAQIAGAELRLQFTRVRSFLEEVHISRQQALYRQYRRALNFQAVMHGLKQADTRVVSLDKQISMRLFRKKKADLNELHMARTLEEAVFLETMMDVVDQVQRSKEEAAREMFELHVEHLKKERDMNDTRKQELELFVAAGTLEMAKMVAQYAEFYAIEQVEETQADQQVECIEREKGFDSSKVQKLNTTKLYDTIVWSVASNDLGLTSSGSSLYSSDVSSSIFGDDEEQEDKEDGAERAKQDAHEENRALEDNNDTPEEKTLTPVGTMHTRQLQKQLREGEKALIKKHEKQVRAERKEFLRQKNALKDKHQAILDGIIEKSMAEREALRAAIDERLDALVFAQEEATERMRKADLSLMKEALFAEDKRVEEAENNSFRKAQELISAQVFHEVRNALSCVIAMSEMTSTLKTDKSLSPQDLVGSVDGMLEQVGDVVDYALKMLNEVLDVSKINSGAFEAKKEEFDLQAVVTRATRMQKSKASKISLAFQPTAKPIFATSDPGIVERVIATMISNSVKFTHNGAVQPFVWPLNMIEQTATTVTDFNRADSLASTASTATMSSLGDSDNQRYSTVGVVQDVSAASAADSNVQLYAVGVADTGCGLTEETLRAAKEMISTATSKDTKHGAQNTGFGLYHAHLQASALGSHLSLARLEDCASLLNDDMLTAVRKREHGQGHPGNRPGKGTVLYFTVPVHKQPATDEVSLTPSSLGKFPKSRSPEVPKWHLPLSP